MHYYKIEKKNHGGGLHFVEKVLVSASRNFVVVFEVYG